MQTNKVVDWILRFIKGMFIGSGFILPGVSGGALSAVFGIYERLIGFLAHITRNFKQNLLFFIPVGLGSVTGIFLLSFAVAYFLEAYEVQILWFFIGCIVGTVPALWREAGKKGRSSKHVIIMVVAFAAGVAFLIFGENATSGNVPQNFGTWIIAGMLISLGLIIPGLSPSNFLLYMGMYGDMADGISRLDMMIILPIAIGAVACVLLFSKLMDYVFQRAYAGLFHVILGVVFASTVMIVPTDFNYLSVGTLVCVGTFVAGGALGWWMSRLEDKYKPSEI